MSTLHHRIIAAAAVLIPMAVILFYAGSCSVSSMAENYPQTLTVDVFDSLANYQVSSPAGLPGLFWTGSI